MRRKTDFQKELELIFSNIRVRCPSHIDGTWSGIFDTIMKEHRDMNELLKKEANSK